MSLILITSKRFGDCRGFFADTYNKKKYLEYGINLEFVQDSHSLSREKGTLRGLHFQKPPRAQAKLVRCGRGAIFDVAVDIRKGSSTFGKWEGYELSAENGHQLFIPVGFAHGFVTLEPNSEVIYKFSDYYAPKTEAVINWNDRDIGIIWPQGYSPILKGNDADAPCLKDIESPFTLGVNS